LFFEKGKPTEEDLRRLMRRRGKHLTGRGIRVGKPVLPSKGRAQVGTRRPPQPREIVQHISLLFDVGNLAYVATLEKTAGSQMKII